MIGMSVGKQDLCHLFRLISKRSKCLHIRANVLAGKCKTVLIRDFFRCPCRKSRINKDHFVTRIDQIILKASSVSYVFVELIRTFLPSKNKRL